MTEDNIHFSSTGALRSGKWHSSPSFIPTELHASRQHSRHWIGSDSNERFCKLDRFVIENNLLYRYNLVKFTKS
jgi:hypothetical protein